MGRVTDRYMCLGCGRFWRVPDFEIVPMKNRCPYCGDIYWVDNVQPNAPPPLFEEIEVKTPCFHKQVVELAGDVNFCTVCSNKLVGSVGNTLRQWQERRLRELSL